MLDGQFQAACAPVGDAMTDGGDIEIRMAPSGLSRGQRAVRSFRGERQRGLTMARMQITHFKCLSCAASIRNGEDKCAACGYERPVASALVSSVREQERGAL